MARPPYRLASTLLLLASLAAPALPDATAAVAVSDADPIHELLGAVNDTRQQAGLAPLKEQPALDRVAAERADKAAAGAGMDATAATIAALSSDLRRAGFRPYSWRQRLVQGPRDAAALLRQWRQSDPQGFADVLLGDYEVFGAALAHGADPPLWSLLVAMPGITWERRQAAPLDDLATVRAGVLASVNAARTAAGLAALAVDERLQQAAQEHAHDMLARNYYDHVSLEGHTLAWRVGAVGYGYRWAAENIAKGVFEPAEVVRRWMQSSGHRHNILDPHLVHAGIGVVCGEQAGEVTALWVLDLGAPG